MGEWCKELRQKGDEDQIVDGQDASVKISGGKEVEL